MPEENRSQKRRMRVVSAPRQPVSEGNHSYGDDARLVACQVGDFIQVRESFSTDRVEALNLRTNETVDINTSELEELSASVLSTSMSEQMDFAFVAPSVARAGKFTSNNGAQPLNLSNTSEIALAASDTNDKEESHMPLDTARQFREDYTKLAYEPPKYAPPDLSYPTRHYKLALLGDTNTGKTSLFLRWQYDQFHEAIGATIGADSFTKHFFEGSFNVRIVLFDTAGQEVYKSITSNSLREADFICFVFSYDDLESFAALPRWIETARQVNPDFIGILIGNKYDLFSSITQEQIEEMIHEGEFRQFFQVSCSVGFGVHRVLQQLMYEDVQRGQMFGLSDNYTKTVLRAEQLENVSRKPGCC